MKRLMMLVLFAGIANTTIPSTDAEAQDFSVGVSASFGDATFFHGSLSTYGEWLELESGFHAWRPRHMRYGWRPYLHGRWAWTDYGWYWISSEPFGWATYHYGRWYYDDYYGWIWIPDRIWGPAWVEWRHNNDYVGWAPLPPYASFSFNIGIRFTTHWFAPHHYWNFVRYRHITSPSIVREVVPMEYARRLISTTRSAGRYDYDNGRVINRGIDQETVRRRGGLTRIDRMDVRESNEVGERMVRDRSAARIEVFRPDRTTPDRPYERIDARQAERGTSLELQRVERGRREEVRTNEPRESERERRIIREEPRTLQDRAQQPEALRPREESNQRRREEPTIVIPQIPPTERREIERRREERYPFPRTEQAPKPAERKAVVPERPQREERRETPTPRVRREESRPAPSIQRESPRSGGQERREGTRRRD